MFNFDVPIENLNPDWILSKISQEEIFQRYLGIYPELNKRYTNPLRPDNKTPNSEFSFYNNYLQFKDWGSGDALPLNCFTIVQKLYNCTFYEALQRISYDFGLCVQSSNYFSSKEERVIYKPTLEVSLKKKLENIRIKKKEYTTKELEFWNCNENFEFDTKFLEKYQIYSTEYVWYNSNPVKSLEGVFAYQLKPNIFQIYSPFVEERKYRFRSTNLKGTIAYYWNLKKSKYVVVTKSVKDAFYLKILGCNAVAFLNEGYIPTEQEILYLQEFGRLVFLYDNDETGRKVVNKIKNLYDVSYLFIEEDYQVKDTYEFLVKHGKKEVLKWLDLNDLI